METQNSGLGTYSISEKAFREIASIACTHIKNIYPYRKDKEFVECDFNKNGELTVDLNVRVKKGIDIVKLCTKVQEEVKESILLMTGVEPKTVNIDIKGFETEK